MVEEARHGMEKNLGLVVDFVDTVSRTNSVRRYVCKKLVFGHLICQRKHKINQPSDVHPNTVRILSPSRTLTNKSVRKHNTNRGRRKGGGGIVG